MMRSYGLWRARVPSYASSSAAARCLSSAAAVAPLDPAHPPSVIILGGLNMKTRALDKVAAALYPNTATQRFTHSLNDIVNVNYRFADNTARLAAALQASGPGGAIVHVFSGAAFFSVLALRGWAAAGDRGGGPAARIRGIVLDSVPYMRIERQLMVAAKVPSLLAPTATMLASLLLVSPLFGATVAVTDSYNDAQLDARNFSAARKVLVAHSVDDDVVPVGQFRDYVATLRRSECWVETPPAGAQAGARAADARAAGTPATGSRAAAVDFTVFEGKGRHAAMVLDDPTYIGYVRQWTSSL